MGIKPIIACLLCLSLICIPSVSAMDVSQNDVIYVPDNPTSIIIYCHPNTSLVHAKTDPPLRPYNTYEGIIQQISKNNPNSIVAAGQQVGKEFAKKISSLIEKYEIKDVIITGWSAGGNWALQLTSLIIKEDMNVKLVFFDCNHTNNISDAVFKKVTQYNNVELHYTCHVMGRSKDRVLQKVREYQIPITYYKLKIPKDLTGSQHIYNRDAGIEFNLCGYLLGTAELNENYEKFIYDYSSKSYIK